MKERLHLWCAHATVVVGLLSWACSDSGSAGEGGDAGAVSDGGRQTASGGASTGGATGAGGTAMGGSQAGAGGAERAADASTGGTPGGTGGTQSEDAGPGDSGTGGAPESAGGAPCSTDTSAGGASWSTSGGAPNAGPPAGCQPGGVITTLVPRGVRELGEIAAAGDWVYFVEKARACTRYGCAAQGSLQRVPRCGGPVEVVEGPLALLVNTTPEPNRLVAGGGHVYLLAAEALLSVRVSDGAETLLPLAPGCTTDVAASATHVVLYDSCTGQILAMPHGGAILGPVATVTASAGTGSVAAGPGEIYFQQGSAVYRRSLSGPDDTRLLYDTGGRILDLAALGGAVFAVTFPLDSWRIYATAYRTPLSTGVPEALGGGLPWTYGASLATDGDDVYFHEVGPRSEVRVSRVGETGAPSPVLRRAYTYQTVLDGRLSWTEQGSVYTAMPQAEVRAGPDVTTPPVWSSVYEYPSAFMAADVLPDGRIVALGTGETDERPDPGGNPARPSTPNRVARIVTYSPTGELGWSALLGKADPGETYNPTSVPLCLSISDTGRIAAVVHEGSYGEVTDAGTLSHGERFSVHRFEPDATALAVTEHSAVPAYSEAACAHDRCGNLYVAYDDGVVKKESPEGTELWSRTVGPSFPNGSRPVALQPTGAGVVLAQLVPGVVSTGSLTGLHSNGDVAWSRAVTGAVITSLDLAPDGRVLVAGTAVDSIDYGEGTVPTPRPLEPFTFLLWLTPDGTVLSLHFVDAVLGGIDAFERGDVRVGPDGSVYLLAGDPQRPAYFEPPLSAGNYVGGVVLAKLDSAAELVWSRNLTPVLDSVLAARGYTSGMGGVRVTPMPFGGFLSLTASHVVVTGSAELITSSLLGVAMQYGL